MLAARCCTRSMSPGRGVAQLGSAPAWGAGGRWFKSSRPDHPLPRRALRMLGVVAYRTAAAAASVLPARAADRLAVGLARLAFHVRVPARAALEKNLAAALPRSGRLERARWARECFESFALALAGFLRGLPTGAAPELSG